MAKVEVGVREVMRIAGARTGGKCLGTVEQLGITWSVKFRERTDIREEEE